MEFEEVTARATLLECIEPLLSALRIPWIYRFLLDADVIDDLKVLSSRQHVPYAFASQSRFELLGLLPVLLPRTMANFLESQWVMVPCFRHERYTALYFLAQSSPPGDRGQTSEGAVGAWQRDTIGVVRGVFDEDTGDILSVYIPPHTHDEHEDVQNTNTFSNCLLFLADRGTRRRKARVFFRPRVDALRSLQYSAIVSSVSFLFAMQEKSVDRYGHVDTPAQAQAPVLRAQHALDFQHVVSNLLHMAGSYFAVCRTVVLNQSGDETNLHPPIKIYGSVEGCTSPGTIARHVQLAIYDVLVNALSKIGPYSTPYPLTVAQAARRALIESRSIFGTQSYTMHGIEGILGTSVTLTPPAAITAHSNPQVSSLTRNTFLSHGPSLSTSPPQPHHLSAASHIAIVSDARSVHVSESGPVSQIDAGSFVQSSAHSRNRNTAASRPASVAVSTSQGADQVAPTSTVTAVTMPTPRPIVRRTAIVARPGNPGTNQHVHLSTTPSIAGPSAAVAQTGTAAILPGTRSTDELSANDIKALRRKLRNRESAARANLKKQQRTAELRSGIAKQKEIVDRLNERLQQLQAENRELKARIEQDGEG